MTGFGSRYKLKAEKSILVAVQAPVLKNVHRGGRVSLIVKRSSDAPHLFIAVRTNGKSLGS